MNPFAAWLLLFGACDQALEQHDRAQIARHHGNSGSVLGARWQHCCTSRVWGPWPDRQYLAAHLYWNVREYGSQDGATVGIAGYRASFYEDVELAHTSGGVPP